jgi:hypothetical protein
MNVPSKLTPRAQRSREASRATARQRSAHRFGKSFDRSSEDGCGLHGGSDMSRDYSKAGALLRGVRATLLARSQVAGRARSNRCLRAVIARCRIDRITPSGRIVGAVGSLGKSRVFLIFHIAG